MMHFKSYNYQFSALEDDTNIKNKMTFKEDSHIVGLLL